MNKNFLSEFDASFLYSAEVLSELVKADIFSDVDDFVRKIRFRDQYVRQVAWFLLTKEVADQLKKIINGKHVLEVFAGCGYLKSHLKEASLSYKAYDNHCFLHKKRDYGYVSRKNAFMALIKDVDVIIMTWARYDKNDAYKVIKKMVSGQILIVNGEPEGGCTANDKFFDYIKADFLLDERRMKSINEHHVRFSGIHDQWFIYQKK